MIINRSAIKHNAKLSMGTSKPSPFLVALVYFAINYVLNILFASVTGQTKMMNELAAAYASGNYEFVPSFPIPTISSALLTIAISLMLMMMATGFTIYCFNVAGRRPASFGNLFDGFTIFFKVLWLNILMFIFVYLWSLLLIIPGIIAAYRYRMALYIMLDNPELGALECIRQSKAMMAGHKGELFVLDLSFLGWFLLSMMPFVSIFVAPYTELTYINYYFALRDMPSAEGFNTSQFN